MELLNNLWKKLLVQFDMFSTMDWVFLSLTAAFSLWLLFILMWAVKTFFEESVSNKVVKFLEKREDALVKAISELVTVTRYTTTDAFNTVRHVVDSFNKKDDCDCEED